MKRYWVPSPEIQAWIRVTYVYDSLQGTISRDGKQLRPQFTGNYHQIRLCDKKQDLRKLVTVHRLAWFLHHGVFPTMPIDHVNFDTCDNRIENLRLCSNAQNSAHRRKTKYQTSSRYKGVSWQSGLNMWRAHVVIDGVKRNLGSFHCEHAAAKAYNAAASKAFGEFAILNEEN